MIDWSSCPAVERDPERVSGAWLFRGTRVPVTAAYALDGAGYLNGDDYLDLVIGVHHFTDGQSNEGQVRVYYGSASGFESGSYWSYVSNQAGASLGAAAAVKGLIASGRLSAVTAIINERADPSSIPFWVSTSTSGMTPAAEAYIGIPIATASGTAYHSSPIPEDAISGLSIAS